MKLNAASNVAFKYGAQWNNIHPSSTDQVKDTKKCYKLEQQFNVITGFAGTTLQPNSGAQGVSCRLFVLTTTRGHRNIALIPSSAHGTNPASAAMAGMKAVTKHWKTEYRY
jgi:glycine dehydrogenase